MNELYINILQSPSRSISKADNWSFLYSDKCFVVSDEDCIEGTCHKSGNGFIF